MKLTFCGFAVITCVCSSDADIKFDALVRRSHPSLLFMSNNSVHGEYTYVSDWRVPTGDWRHSTSAADGLWRFADRDTTQSMQEGAPQPQPRDSCDADALRAILLHVGAGEIHTPAVRPRPTPRERGHYNVSWQKSTTASSFEMPPKEPSGLPHRDESIPPKSGLHRRLYILENFAKNEEINPFSPEISRENFHWRGLERTGLERFL